MRFKIVKTAARKDKRLSESSDKGKSSFFLRTCGSLQFSRDLIRIKPGHGKSTDNFKITSVFVIYFAVLTDQYFINNACGKRAIFNSKTNDSADLFT